MRALLIPVDQPPTVVDLDDDTWSQDLARLVGGQADPINLPDGLGVLWINADGKSQCLPRNDAATALAQSGRPGDWVVGAAVLAGSCPEGCASLRDAALGAALTIMGVVA